MMGEQAKPSDVGPATIWGRELERQSREDDRVAVQEEDRQPTSANTSEHVHQIFLSCDMQHKRGRRSNVLNSCKGQSSEVRQKRPCRRRIDRHSGDNILLVLGLTN